MAASGEWFKEWLSSPFYHLLYFRRDEEAGMFIDRLLERIQPSSNSFILDVSCGRGHHSRLMAERGFDVTGIDLSFGSIREARHYETDNLHFFQHDLRLPFWMNYFDYAFNLFTPFGYYRTEREHHNAIRTIANALKPGGLLVMDYLNVDHAREQLAPTSDEEIDGVRFHFTRWFDDNHFYSKMLVEGEQLPQPLVFQERTARFSLDDFKRMFLLHDLQLQEVFGDYSFTDYHPKTSPRMLMVGKKVVSR